MSHGHQVLVVEDDVDIREALVEILEDHGCQVAAASNGERALAMLRAARALPCIILLDLMMPVMDGTAFREAQLKDPALAHIPVVVLSAYRDVQAAAATLNAVSVMKKPPSIDELVATIQRHC